MSFQYPCDDRGRRRGRRWPGAGLRGAAAAADPALAAAGCAGRAGAGACAGTLPPMLFLAAWPLLLLGRRPSTGDSAASRAPSGTVILAFDVSNSMAATDVAPTRLAAAQAAAIGFVQAQPDTVDIGVVAFDQGALTTRCRPTTTTQAIAAINRLTVAGGTSLGPGHPGLADHDRRPAGHPARPGTTAAPPADLGYWGSATIVLLSDGEDTGGPDARGRRRAGRRRRRAHRDHRGRHGRPARPSRSTATRSPPRSTRTC